VVSLFVRSVYFSLSFVVACVSRSLPYLLFVVVVVVVCVVVVVVSSLSNSREYLLDLYSREVYFISSVRL
jgi:hypothetical protein